MRPAPLTSFARGIGLRNDVILLQDEAFVDGNYAMKSHIISGISSRNDDALSEYAALRNEITARISMVSEQGFSTAIALFAIFTMYVTLGCSNIASVVEFSAMNSLLAILSSSYLYLAALKSGENIRQIVQLAAYCREFYERDEEDGLHWESYLAWANDDKSLAKDERLRRWYNKEYCLLALLSMVAYTINMVAFAMRPAIRICNCWFFVLIVLVNIVCLILLTMTYRHTDADLNFSKQAEKCAEMAIGYKSYLIEKKQRVKDANGPGESEEVCKE